MSIFNPAGKPAVLRPAATAAPEHDQLAVLQLRQRPVLYSAPTYRCSYSGRNYDTSQYGADLLRRSVNNGYQEGSLAGQADRQDRWRSGYRDSWAYQDANYGYTGMYIDQPQYNYYFRQGFRRGYDDGYSARYRYGRNNNGSYQIVASLVSQILNLRSLQ